MNVQTADLSDTRRQLTVTIPADSVAAAERDVLREIAGQVRLPGFRPGKAPVDLVRRKYSRELRNELETRLRRDAYKAAIEEPKLDVLAIIDVTGPELNGGETSVAFTVDLRPSFELPEYKGIPVTVPPVDVTDEQVEEAITALRRERATFQVVERAAGTGDYVKLTYTGSVDGQTIAEIAPDAKLWGTQANTWEEAGSTAGLGVPAVVAGIVGLQAGDKATFTQEFGDDFEVEALRGKTGTYEVEVHEVRERQLPEFNDEFAKSLGAADAAQLREQIRGDLERMRRSEKRDVVIRQIVSALESRVEFPLPESAVERETQRIMGEIMIQNLQRGISEEELESRKEEIFNNARQTALIRTKVNFILERIAEKEGVTAGNEDLSRAIMFEAQRTRQRPDLIVKELQADQNRLREFRTSVLRSKTMDILVDAVAETVGEAPVPAGA